MPVPVFLRFPAMLRIFFGKNIMVIYGEAHQLIQHKGIRKYNWLSTELIINSKFAQRFPRDLHSDNFLQ